jgi:putative addiction module component (TIGR02574 family)
MSANFDVLSAQAVSLPLDQRIELAQRHWQSAEGQVDEDAELAAEFERRCAELDSGTGRTYSHEEVMLEAKKAASRES